MKKKKRKNLIVEERRDKIMIFIMIIRRGRKKGESKEKRMKIGFKISDFQRTLPPPQMRKYLFQVIGLHLSIDHHACGLG